MANAEPLQNKTWDLSLYELHRQPQEAITDSTEIAVSPRSLHSELMCPICLDMLKKTMTTKECLHRFCSDCIITALRSGNKECPTCRKKLVSKRSLRPDPNFDLLISKIYPSRDEYEAHQERVLAKFNQSHSQAALVNSITVGIKMQSQNRPHRANKKGNEAEPGTGTGTNANGGSALGVDQAGSSTGTNNNNNNSNAGLHSNPASVRSTPSPVPSNNSYGSKLKRSRSVLTSERSEESESNSEMDCRTTERDDDESNAETEGDGNSDAGMSDEIELVFKPHPVEMAGDQQLLRVLKENCVRYIKTTSNATVDHLSKYLAMRLTLDLEAELSETHKLVNFCIYIAPQPMQLVVLSGNQSLQQVNEKFWKVNKPLEMFYSWKRN